MGTFIELLQNTGCGPEFTTKQQPAEGRYAEIFQALTVRDVDDNLHKTLFF